MSYVDDNLLTGETVVYRAQMSWAIFVWPVLFCLTILLLPLGLLLLILALIKFLTTEMAVTSRRVIGKRGLISRHSLDLNHNRVESIQVDQGVFGRIFRGGTVTVRGTGGTISLFPGIKDPYSFRRQALEAIEVDYPMPAPGIPQRVALSSQSSRREQLLEQLRSAQQARASAEQHIARLNDEIARLDQDH